MNKNILDEILMSVKKPSRYINHELNSHPADMSADFSICLSFPDIYEVGASNLGIEILYHLINEKKLARCERCYAPDIDMEKLLRERKIPLFSIESNSPLSSFDIIGFTIQCELAATNIVNMIDLAGLNCFAKDRKENDPLIIAGGPALTNPEPFCDFFDLFVLGDGEEVIEDIINVCLRNKKKISKENLLRKLSEIEGVYVPSLYIVEYNDDNTIKSVIPKDGVKPVVKKRVLNLENAFFPKNKIVPFVETVHNRLNIEVARGCPGQCRFCQASKYYRPWRQRSIDNLLQLVDEGIKSTGYEEVSFASLSCSDYKDLDKLLIKVNEKYLDSKLNISLPSLRCNERSIKIVQYISRNKKPTLTFAPEAGTDRLRNVIGKYLSRNQILTTLFLANQMGWEVIKLYFMIGLPTETKEDLDGIKELVQTARQNAKKLKFTITVSPFVPKAQTAFQWAPMEKSEIVEEKIKYLKTLLSADIKAHNHFASILEAFIARGDRRLSSVIYKVWQKGSRFDQWADRFGNQGWLDCIKESSLDLDFYVYRQRKSDEIFAWDHLNFGVDKETLYADYIKGINETAQTINESFNQKNAEFPKNLPKLEETAPPIMRVRLRFSKKGIVKYISHLEQIEVFRRVIRRSGLPIAFSAGFSPQIKASYGPPLTVGYESLSEYVDLCLIEKISLDQIRDAISKTLPESFSLLDIKHIPVFFPSIDSLVNLVEYKIYDCEFLQKEIDDFLIRDEIIIKKEKKGKVNEINIKPIIKEIKIENKDLILKLYYAKDKVIKPDLILKEICPEKSAENFLIERSNLFIELPDGSDYII
ncbi:MAG: TIGR03960 family B12-binding radical SAM protein [Elusimicrobiota bacterium]|jgi:radical SAM family uncharacterized protein/radical SAM-linked protein|nr:TIGR03960 family B12-binding radical SAM protein [Elusimicrobiota bacterium]